VAHVLLFVGASALELSATARSVQAQSMDYGALEQLFGEPVTASATGKPQKASDVPADMVIVTQDDIRRSGADNIPDILQYVTGLNVRRGGFAEANVAIRGYNQANTPRLLVLLNGREVYLSDYGYVAWQTIPVQLDEIRQIEVVKGPNSALFGFNAVGGVVNIITYDPLTDNTNVVTARTGTQQLKEGDVVTTVHAFDRAGVRISAGGYLAQDFKDTPGFTSPRPLDPKQGMLSADGKVRIAPGVEMTFSASKSDANNFGQAPIGSYSNRYWRTNSVQSGLTADTRIGTLTLNAYRNGMDYANHLIAGAVTSFRNVVYVVQASDLTKLNPSNTIRIGLEYRNNAADSPTMFLGTTSYQVISGSAMWDWQISPSLSLTNALRLDYLMLGHSDNVRYADGFTSADFNNRTITEPSYNTGLVYRLTDNDTFRATAARGVQVPSLAQFGFSSGANPNLDPEIVSNYEAAYDRKLDGISSVIRTALFYQTNTDILTTTGSSPLALAPNGTLVKISNNIGSSDEIGWEIGIKGQSASGWRWNASYALASVTENVISNLGRIPDTPFDFEHGTPVHTVIFGGGYSIGSWEFDADARWQSKYRDYATPSGSFVLHSKLISDFITFSARVGYQLTEKITLAVSAQQLAQDRIVETAGLPVERRIIASATARF
jgi:iron complex outermembrane receptor protein